MGKKKKYTKDQRLEILKISEQEGIKEVSKRLGISYTTICTWKKRPARSGLAVAAGAQALAGRYSEGGEEALGKRSGGHHKGKRNIDDWKVKEVLAEKEESPGSGPSQM